MKVRFWGVRGSIPVPGPKTVRYGGNTTCIEVRTSDDQLIILDAGTGIYQLSRSLLPELPITAHIFNTHTHWDHIQGLPFFIPLFVPDNKVHIYGGFEPVSGQPIDEVLSAQLQYRFFPVREAELLSEITYHTLHEHESVQIGNATITLVLMNHPVINFGYRIDDQGKSMFFTGDHEVPLNIYDPEDEEYEIYQQMLNSREQGIIDTIKDVDLLIADAAYTEEEYPQKKGWGHGTFNSSIRLGQQAGARKVCLTHHEPSRDDDSLEKVFAEALHDCKAIDSDSPEYLLAHEGLIIEL